MPIYTFNFGPGRIVIDDIYLLELRQVTPRVFQAVLYYDAD